MPRAMRLAFRGAIRRSAVWARPAFAVRRTVVADSRGFGCGKAGRDRIAASVDTGIPRLSEGARSKSSARSPARHAARECVESCSSGWVRGFLHSGPVTMFSSLPVREVVGEAGDLGRGWPFTLGAVSQLVQDGLEPSELTVLRAQRDHPRSARRRRLRSAHRHRKRHRHVPAGGRPPREMAPADSGRSGHTEAGRGGRLRGDAFA